MKRTARAVAFVMTSFLCCWSTGVSAAPIDPVQTPSAVLPFMKNVPTIDGVISDEEWADAMRVDGMVDFQKPGTLHARHAVAWFGSDGKRIYVAVQSELPTVGSLLSRVRKRDGALWFDDSIEIWLAPTRRTKTKEDIRYFQFVGNSIDTIFDVAHVPGQAQAPWDGDWEFKNTLRDGWWHSEASVSIESLGCTSEDLAHEWRVNVCRDWQQPMIYASWSPATGGFANRDGMASVRWDPAAPIVHATAQGALFRGQYGVELSARNATDKPLDMNLQVLIQPEYFQTLTQEKTIALSPGASESVKIEGGVSDERKHTALLRATSHDEAITYFTRAFVWQKQTSPTWAIGQQEAKAVDLSVVYYPYPKKLRANVDISGLSAAAAVRKANFVITRKGASEALARGELTHFADKKGELIIQTPALETGTYVVSMKLEGGEGVPGETYTQEFERKVFVWEHNNLGKSRVVLPPFTPLQVNASRVESIFRSHAMNDQGLWGQVTSNQENLLTAPMRFEARSNGQPVKWNEKKLQFTEQSPDRVTARCEFAGGPVEARLENQFDYDGMMKVTMTLSPRDTGEIDSLDLLIPLRDEVAPLMHVCVDGVLANPAGAVPAGQGVIWDSTKTQRTNTFGTWVPYIWLGGPGPGVCFFSDTDRDWVLDDTKPAIDIVRADGVLTLRVHLINTPTTLSRQHTIVFGIQATPVKPMAQNWRRWDFLSRNPQAEKFFVLWSTTLWGGISDFESLYPRGEDFTVWQKFQEARRTGQVDWAFVEQWIQKNKELGINNWDALKYGMADAARPDQRVLLYIDARNGCDPETEVYFRADGFSVEPTETWRDCALYYINKMFDYGFDGVFIDEAYLRANFDTVAGGAYLRSDGNVQPTMGLFSLREFNKRLATLCHERGIPNYTVEHMTTCNVVPARAFTPAGLDWEAAYGTMDFQQKFPPDYVLAQSAGLQTGMVPLVLGGAITTDEQEKLRLSRTQFAVAAVHECKIVADGRTAGLHKPYAAMYEFGYGLSDCKVYTYWERAQPIKIDGPQNKALVAARSGETLVIVADYGGGGDCTLAADRKTLGLRESFTATDAETGQPLPVVDGHVKFPLKKHDFRMIILE